jgi:hypothetical protein
MATVLGTWGEPEHAEASLMHAGMAAVLGALAALEGVAINHETHTVDVVVRLPEGLVGRARDFRIAWVRAQLADLVANMFAGDGLVLDQVHIVESGTSQQASPIRPRQGSG